MELVCVCFMHCALNMGLWLFRVDFLRIGDISLHQSQVLSDFSTVLLQLFDYIIKLCFLHLLICLFAHEQFVGHSFHLSVAIINLG